jgi:hypothetical protein
MELPRAYPSFSCIFPLDFPILFCVSEDPTKDIGEKYQTKPTLETILERINALGEGLNARIDGLEIKLTERIDKFEQHVEARFDRTDNRLDDLTTKMKLLNEDVLQMRSDISRMTKRVEGIETHFKEPA